MTCVSIKQDPAVFFYAAPEQCSMTWHARAALPLSPGISYISYGQHTASAQPAFRFRLMTALYCDVLQLIPVSHRWCLLQENQGVWCATLFEQSTTPPPQERD